MLAVGLWLLALGVADLFRAGHDETSSTERGLVATIGVVLFLVMALVAGPSGATGVLLILGGIAGLLAWVLLSALALQGAGPLARGGAFAGLVLGFGVVMVAGGGIASDPALPAALGGSFVGDWDAARTTLVCGVLLVQLATANIAVRLVLDAVGVPAATNEKKLKGGRVLGPMERVFIVVLGLAGAGTAAAVVVAAKGLLRFPEVRREINGPSDVTEYFLIGSFASWLVAVGGVALLAG